MKREIKFRVKANHATMPGSYESETEWYYFGVFDGNGGLPYFVDYETVGQYTGLKDRNSKEIYEGDFFKLGVEKEIYEVRFEHGCFMAYYKGRQYGLIGELQVCFIKVIGNIHENPELLNIEQ